MIFNSEEQKMYRMIQAVYDSGIPISFKGSLVLKAVLVEKGFTEDTRHTSDIDGNWDSADFPSAELLQDSLQKAVDKAGLDMDVSMFRMYGEGKSAGFKLYDRKTKEQIFSMDIDVKGPVPSTTMYELSGIRFRGISPS